MNTNANVFFLEDFETLSDEQLLQIQGSGYQAVGALGGAFAGGSIGLKAGSFFGPWGVAIGGVGGAVIGGTIGWFAS